jgi:alpha-mannosidase
MRLAIVPHGSDWDAAGVVGLAERFAQPLVATAGTGRTEAPKFQPGLSIDGDGVALTSLRRVTSVDAASGAAEPTTTSTGDAGGAENAPRWLELRCVNESLEPTTARISMPGGIQTARQADLIGRPGDPLPVEGSAVHLNLAPWEIATMQLSLPFPRASRLR